MKKINRYFTLMELLVSMGIFSILLVIMMQFFSSAQKVTTAAEKKSTVYARVRNSLDMASTLLQNTSPLSDFDHKAKPASGDSQWNGAPFLLRNSYSHDNFNGSAIIFPAKSQYRFAGNSPLMYIGLFGLNTNAKRSDADFGELRLAVFTDDQSDYTNLWPPLNVSGNAAGDLDYAKKKLAETLTEHRNQPEEAANAKYRIILLKNVVEFSFVAYCYDKSDGKMQPVSTSDYADRLKRPYAIELRVSVLNEDDFSRYKELLDAAGKDKMSAETADIKAFREQNQHTFNRFIFLNSHLEE